MNPPFSNNSSQKKSGRDCDFFELFGKLAVGKSNFPTREDHFLSYRKTGPKKWIFRIWTKSSFLCYRILCFFGRTFSGISFSGALRPDSWAESGRVHTQKTSPEKCHYTHKSRTAQQVLVVERPSRAPSNPRATAVPSGPLICDVRWSDAPKRGARRHTTPRPCRRCWFEPNRQLINTPRCTTQFITRFTEHSRR